MGGRLHPNGITEGGIWDSSRLHWWTEDHVDKIIGTTRERKVRTTEELDAAMQEPMKVAPTRDIGIHESMEVEARRLAGSGRSSSRSSGAADGCGAGNLFWKGATHCGSVAME